VDGPGHLTRGEVVTTLAVFLIVAVALIVLVVVWP
jgi:hypothetical protein